MIADGGLCFRKREGVFEERHGRLCSERAAFHCAYDGLKRLAKAECAVERPEEG